jgi:predicted permease
VSRDARPGLGGGNRSITSRSRAREALVVAQLALSLIGVASAGLLIHSLERLRAADTGLTDPGHILLATSDFDLAGGGYAGFDDDPRVRARRLPLAMEILRRARALPGVQSAALMDSPPLGLVSSYDAFNVQIPGYVARPHETLSFEICYATPDYFSVVGPPIVRGRGFDDTDNGSGQFAAVVNEAFARRFWRGADPSAAAIGKEVRVGARSVHVVGVVRDGKYHSLSEAPQPFFYLAYEQWSPSALTVALRTSGDPLALTEPLHRIFHEVDPALPFLDPRTLADQVNGALTLQRLGAALLTCLGTLALLIAGLGLYGVLVQAVQQRQREIGIRLAVGASAAHVLRQFLMRGMLLASLGVVLGVPGVLLVGRLLRGQVFGVGTVDPIALGGTALVFGVVAAVASVTTAARAARVDPATSLRAD